MTHTNVYIRSWDYDNQDLGVVLLKAERDFWKSRAEYYRKEMSNIPEAVKECGYVDIDDGREKITLVKKRQKKEQS